MRRKLNIANAVTISRIIFAILVLFSSAFSIQFYIFYLPGAITDMIDGTIARKLNLKSKLGAKLDTIADCVFVVAVLIKILSAIYAPSWLWIWVAIISLIKLINVISSVVMFRRLIPIHTVMNKITGVMLFLLPFSIREVSSPILVIEIIVTGSFATFAAIQEGHFIRTGKEIE